MNLCQCFFNLAFTRVGNTNIMNKDRIILITIPVIIFTYRISFLKGCYHQ